LSTPALEHTGRIHAIENEANSKTLENRRRLDDQLQSSAQRAADFELEQERRRLDGQGLGGPGGFKQQEAALDAWYAKRITILNAELEQARTAHGIETAEYQRVVERMNELDRERLKEQQRIQDESLRIAQDALGAMDRTFNANVIEWIKGQKTFGQAMMETWNELAASAIQNMIRMAQQALISALIHKAIAKDSIFADAKAAAAGVWRSVMQSGIPFPFNVAAAAVAAGGVFAATVALASFDKGGIMPATDIALLHKNEMVLPANLSQGFQAMLAAGGAGGGMGGPTVHLGGIHFHGPADKKTVDYAKEEIARAVKKAIRSGHLKFGDAT
jgi:hypothetical protein